ncbi:hypothetical protein TFLX_01152 [Thermoflexales bacterium]|nr:hypothetical protein TFLX_01152 [Thermoflexales bacterium]
MRLSCLLSQYAGSADTRLTQLAVSFEQSTLISWLRGHHGCITLHFIGRSFG